MSGLCQGVFCVPGLSGSASVAVSVDLENDCVVNEPVDGGDGHSGVTERLMMPPFWIA
jgi:hypothetical protein